MKTRGERLRSARGRFFRSARAAAKAMDIPVATYGAHERAETPGGRDYGPNEAERYGRRFKVRPEWLLTGRGPNPEVIREEPVFEAEAPDLSAPPTVKVKGYVGAGAQAHFYAVSQGDLDEVPAPDGSTKDTAAVEIRGDSLGSLFDRWIVFYDEVRRPVTSDLMGKLCIVGLDDDRVLIKKIRPGARKGIYRLLSEHEGPIENAVVEWAARVKIMTPP
jgi:hypothetical protein